MSLKIHLWHWHLYFYASILVAASDKHGEKFRYDISTMEKRYTGKSSQNILADYCWNIIERCLLPFINNVLQKVVLSLS